MGSVSSIASSNTGAVVITNRGTLDGNVALSDSGSDDFTNTGKRAHSNSAAEPTPLTTAAAGPLLERSRAEPPLIQFTSAMTAKTVNGGKSHDLIYGGTGADTFAFSSFLATDYDRVFGFIGSGPPISIVLHGAFVQFDWTDRGPGRACADVRSPPALFT
jgi:hypothetical protein